ncbi:MAG TPA: OB-fold domain-containing protein [Acidimicrobiales bacterium]|jgi:uncharacterized OB-fold protein
MVSQIPMVDYLVLDEGGAHLEAHECTGCGALFFDRRNACAACGKREFRPKRLSNDGLVRTFTIVQRAAPGVPAPFASAVVDLDGGGKVKANIVGVDPTPENIKLGMPVTLTTFAAGTDDNGIEAVAFGYRPV